MPTMVTIGGVSVDQDDPCALHGALYQAKLKLLAGDRVEEIEVQSPATRRRVKVAASNIKALDEELARLATACNAKIGGQRTRFAKSIRFG